MKVPYPKNIHSMFQGPPNPGFRSVKVQTEDFLKKRLKTFKKFFLLRVPMNTRVTSLEQLSVAERS